MSSKEMDPFAASAQSLDRLQHTPEQAEGQPQSQPAAENHAPFACNICKRNYTRIDHLQRHVRSHTKEKPFACEICGKDFARADLKNRHVAAHDDSGGAKKKRRITSPSLPSRVSQACTACAATKLKCGEEKPCQRCVQRGIPCLIGPQEVSPPVSQSHSELVRIPPPPLFNGVSESPAKIGPETGTVFQPSANVFVDMRRDDNHGLLAQDIQPMSMDFDPNLFPDTSSLGDFLTEIMMPYSPADMKTNPNTNLVVPGLTMPQYNPRDVLDFAYADSHLDLDLDDFDFGFLSSFQNPPIVAPPILAIDDPSYPPSRDGDEGGHPTNIENLGNEAFKKSHWRWVPAETDRGNAEQMNLSLPDKDAQDSRLELIPEARLSAAPIDQVSRDRIMAMIFSTCEPAAISRIVSSFPSATLLDRLMQQFMLSHASQSNAWIHFASLRPHLAQPDFVGILVAAGAVLSPLPAIRKLGYAIQEAVRSLMPGKFEADNTCTRDLQTLQTYALWLMVAMWSGQRRKTEIAESHGLPLVTMLRRSGKLRRPRTAEIVVYPTDSGKVLEEKWNEWIEQESFKRLAFHVMIHDTQISMSNIVPPLVRYTEVTLSLPSPTALWLAKDAYAWKEAYLRIGQPRQALPSLAQCVYDAQPLLDSMDHIDFSFSTNIILYRTWSLIWDYRQLSGAEKQQNPNHTSAASLMSSAWHQELCRLLHNFRLTVSEGQQLQQTTILYEELLLLNLHVSFEDLQVFAGKEGRDEARRVYPSLRHWAQSRDSRQAAWHAGQVVRAAEALPDDALRDFYAIALYHAGLTLWAYGMLSQELAPRAAYNHNNIIVNNNTNQTPSGARASTGSALHAELVCLNGDDTAESQRFVALNRGSPALRRSCLRQLDASGRDGVPLTDSRGVMEIIIGVLRGGSSHGGSTALAAPGAAVARGSTAGAAPATTLPPLVENLSLLMRDLGSAAQRVQHAPRKGV